jgi:chemotaxis signal transduction protein
MNGRDFLVVDLRKKLGIPAGADGRFPCVVVVEVAGTYGHRWIGFYADRVSGVVTLRQRDFRNGTVHATGRARRVLDPDEILSENELLSVWELTAGVVPG